MSSSSQSSALTRRRRRCQPLRRCKRFRGDPGGGPFFIDIPEPVLRHILGFTMWEDEEDDEARCLALWKWTGELGIVCRVFRRVARQVAPDELSLNLPDAKAAALLGTFLDAPWKKTNLVKLHCMRIIHLPSFLALFEQPDSFPNLENFLLSHYDVSNVDLNATFFYNLAQSCPNLSELHLYLPYGIITPDEFGTFGQMLRHPLRTLHLQNVFWMTGAHLVAFLRHHGESLTEMSLSRCRITDACLVESAQHCCNLEKFCATNTEITTEGLSTFLQANPSLRELNICYSSLSGLAFIDILIQHAPQLEKINVSCCIWLTDELLDRLVQGQIDYWTDRREQIRLAEVGAGFTSVTRDGVDRILAKPHVGGLDIIRCIVQV